MRETTDDFQKTLNELWFRFIRVQIKQDPPVASKNLESGEFRIKCERSTCDSHRTSN